MRSTELTIMYDRIEPLTPIREPTVVKSGLSNMKPALLLQHEFSEEIERTHPQRRAQTQSKHSAP